MKNPSQLTTVFLRTMIRRDFSEVLRIEKSSFAYPWTEKDFLTCQQQGKSLLMVAHNEDQILGYIIYEFHPGYLKILNFAVAPEWRRQKIGTWMIDTLIKKLPEQQRHAIQVELRETNLLAQKFFQAQHFRGTGVIRKHYEDSGEDAYMMEFRLPPKETTVPAPKNRVRAFLKPNSDN